MNEYMKFVVRRGIVQQRFKDEVSFTPCSPHGIYSPTS
jgi:hypothetical protein